jgi:peptidoglycan/LPS O-acetylase OafA/YrhL
MPLSATHIPALDGLRGIAVLTVMLLHFNMLGANGPFDRALSTVFSIGWVGVDLFFVLSGFLITGILVDAKGATYYFRNFYLRRSLRIFPLYYAFLVVILVLLPWVRPGSMEHLEGQGWLWTYLSNVLFARVGWEGMPEHTIHLWSLAIEEQFYLLWPLVVFLCDRKTLVRVALTAIAGAIVFRVVSILIWPTGIAGYALLPARMDALALGGLLAVIIRSERGRANAHKLAKRLLVPGLALLAVAIAWSAIFHPQDGLLPALAPHTQLFGYAGNELVSGALVLYAIANPGAEAFQRVLSWKPLMAMGKYSYGLYLIHVPVRDFIRSWLDNGARYPVVFGTQVPAQMGVFVLGIGISVLLALLSWHGFEKHFLKLKDYFPYNAPRRKASSEPRAMLSAEQTPAQQLGGPT